MPAPLLRPLLCLVSSAFCLAMSRPVAAANHLAGEKSPYLRQHVANPVDWYPWGEDAFAKARAENKPIFLSIGYSTCHWCHVMAAESFSDPATAALLNEHFIAIKVDREERPDVDALYQTFVQASTGAGGWPLSVWLTPDRQPFFGGTYFPPENEGRRPGFKTLLTGLARAWATQPERIRDQSAQMLSALAPANPTSDGTNSPPWPELRATTLAALQSAFDPLHAGFDPDAKFPSPSNLELLVDLAGASTTPASDRAHALNLLIPTLHAIVDGGLHDHVGGGFHRYTVDRAWRVPHFEKMLYDQAQLVSVLLSAWQLSPDPDFRTAALDTLRYVQHDLTATDGGFTSAEDADSAVPGDLAQHREGAFYTWTATEIDTVLAPGDRVLFRTAFGITDAGNVAPANDPQGELAGQNVLALTHDLTALAATTKTPVDQLRARLRLCLDQLNTARHQRPRPSRDDKIVTAWNGLMISACARAAQILDDPSALASAQRAARFIRTHLYHADTGDLGRSYHDGQSDAKGFPEDYASLIQGLLDLYETDFDPTWLAWALQLQDRQDALFWDDAQGGYFASASSDASLVLRLKTAHDNAEPAATSIAVRNLGRLAALFHRADFLDRARTAARSLATTAQNEPLALPALMAATGWLSGDAQQALIHGSPTDPQTLALLHELRQRFHPRRVTLCIDATSRPFFETQVPFVAGLPDGAPDTATAYLCENFVCQLPVTTPAELAALLDQQHPSAAP